MFSEKSLPDVQKSLAHFGLVMSESIFSSMVATSLPHFEAVIPERTCNGHLISDVVATPSL